MCVGYLASSISPLDKREGNPSILALTGNCWPRFMAGGRFGRHFDKEHFGGIGMGKSSRCKGERFTLPCFEIYSPAFSFPWSTPSLPSQGTGIPTQVLPRFTGDTTLISKSALNSDPGGSLYIFWVPSSHSLLLCNRSFFFWESSWPRTCFPSIWSLP